MGTETWIISLPLSDSILYLKIIHPPNFREEPLNKRRSFYNMIIHEYVQQGLSPIGARQPQEDDKRLMEEFLKQSGDDLTCGCLLTIYRIRNNLMHGLKQIEDLDTQLDLFKAVNEVLESVREVS